ncbi:MAG: ligase-associated DNA damage response exonuclease [Aquimonas sp.]|nr:ligase-associated DNA damage response exonuclease [Aquimonas sp.]
MKTHPIQLSPSGLYCPAGDFHVDPWRPVPRAVITHAHSDHARPGSALYFAHVDSLPLLRWRLGEDASLQPVAYGERFRLGDAWLSLHPAGHVLGSAQLRVEVGDQVWVVSGDYKRDPDPTCPGFEVVPCDTFITEATFALPVYRWRPTAEVAQEVLDWWDSCAARGETAVLGCYALGKAQRLLAELGALPGLRGRRVLLHGAMLPAVQIYREAGVAMAATEAVSEQARGRELAGELVLAPPSALGTPWMRRFKAVSTGFASGWMRLRGNRRRRGFDRGFVLSDHADWPGLVDTVLATGARRVLATHGSTDVLVRHLRERGIEAAALATELGGEN